MILIPSMERVHANRRALSDETIVVVCCVCRARHCNIFNAFSVRRLQNNDPLIDTIDYSSVNVKEPWPYSIRYKLYQNQ